MTRPLLVCAALGALPTLAWADCPSTLTVNQRLSCLNGALNVAVGRIDVLEADLAAAEADLAAANATITALDSRVAAMEASEWDDYLTDLSGVLSVSGGDVVIDGANLRVRSGSGATDAAVNGKGNLIVGYDEG